MLSHVWMNILSNAIKFSPQNSKIKVTCTQKDDVAIVRITDYGFGMSNEVIEHIFEKFYQGDQSHAASGNGLGLSIAARVVDLCMGKIKVESDPEKGSTFEVMIPINI